MTETCYGSSRPGLTYRLGELKQGMPLGGIGTGCLEIDGTGAFRRSSLQNNWVRELDPLPSGSFFAVRTSVGSKTVCRMLQAEGRSGVPGVRNLEYVGHFPFVELEYLDEELPVRLSLEAFCPFVPYDAMNSAIPAIVYTFRTANDGDAPAEVSVAFSWTNDLGAASHLGPLDNVNAVKKTDDLVGVMMTTRRGDSAGHDEYTVAAVPAEGVQISILPNWSAIGVGAEFWDAFSAGGLFEHVAQARAPLSDTPSGAVACKVTVPSGECREMRFLLAWYMPNHRDAAGAFRGHMYANWFSGAWEVAEHVSANIEKLRRDSLGWQSLIYESSLPDWMKEAVVNYSYVLPRCSWWTKDGTFAVYESIDCPLMEMALLRCYELPALITLFPELDAKATDLVSRYQRSSGEIPTGSGHNSLDEPNFGSFRQQNSPSYVIAAYFHYLWAGGEPYLESAYEKVKRAVHFTMSLDTDGDCLVNCNGHRDTGWDTWPVFGTSVYVAQFWLLALRAAEEMAKVLGDDAFAEECRHWFNTATLNFEEQLWTGDYYALYRDKTCGDYSSSCFIGQFHAQALANVLGLGSMFPEDHIVRGLQTIERLNVAGTPFGATSGVKPDGRRDVSSTLNAQSCCVAPTEIFPYVAACFQAGLTELGLRVAQRVCSFIADWHKDPWHSLLFFHADSGDHFYGKHYIDNLNVWLLPLAVAGLTVDVSQRKLVLRPALDPVRVPVFSQLFFGMVDYRSALDVEGRPELELTLDNRSQQVAQLGQLVVRFRGTTVSSGTRRGVDGQTNEISQLRLTEGAIVVSEPLVLEPGITQFRFLS